MGDFTGPCSAWATEDDITCGDISGVDAPIVANMLDVASELLYIWTGKMFTGGCELIVRPCAQSDPSAPLITPVNYSLSTWVTTSRLWGGACSCNRTSRCGCSRLHEIRLSYSYIQEVTEVKVDGVILPTDEYRLDDDHWLIRLPDSDGINVGWPCCQNLELPDTEDDTFSVELTVGLNPPRSGTLAAAILAYNLIQACVGGSCALPARATSIARQGVSFDVATIGALLDNRRTGIQEVDYFLEAYGTRKGGYGNVTSPDEEALYRITS